MSNRKLDVYLNQILAGWLRVEAHGEILFRYDKKYAQNHENKALSFSLPLRESTFTSKECRPFFSGILPEARLRTNIAKKLGISEKNDFSLLAAIGGECAGAVSILPHKTSLEHLQSDYQVLRGNKLLEVLKSLHQRPMIVGEDGFRLSLAGAQDKLPVALIDDEVALPMGRAPSTHILKPMNREFPGLIENEHFCLELARKVGLHAVESSLHTIKDYTYLLVKRYDRKFDEKGIIRLHQEDFCQARGIIPEMKYQREGGPSIPDCISLIRKISDLPAIDINRLLQGILFNLIIGNNDAHGKNFSILYRETQTRLAPFYDLISTVYFPDLAKNMAMKIGSKYDFNLLFFRHLEQMAEESRLSRSLVRKELEKMLVKVNDNLANSPFSNPIRDRIKKIERRLAARHQKQQNENNNG